MLSRRLSLGALLCLIDCASALRTMHLVLLGLSGICGRLRNDVFLLLLLWLRLRFASQEHTIPYSNFTSHAGVYFNCSYVRSHFASSHFASNCACQRQTSRGSPLGDT